MMLKTFAAQTETKLTTLNLLSFECYYAIVGCSTVLYYFWQDSGKIGNMNDYRRSKKRMMKSNYKQMKSSMTKIVTHRDDYNTCEIPCGN
jgi:hypothetical protein